MTDREKQILNDFEFSFGYISARERQHEKSKFILKIIALGVALEIGIFALYHKALTAILLKTVPAILWLPSMIYS